MKNNANEAVPASIVRHGTAKNSGRKESVMHTDGGGDIAPL